MSKFEKVFLYVLNKIGHKPNVGETFLHKIMYFIDFDYYEKTYESLTGVDYFKNKHGPTFAKSHIQKMEKKGLIKIQKETIGDFIKTKITPLKESDLKGFSREQKEHIDKTLDKHSNKTKKQIEKFSHEDIPWITTERYNDKISYGTVFYRTMTHSVTSERINNDLR